MKNIIIVLGLERKWPTQCCWTRLIVTLTGMCVVDMHRLYRSEKPKRNRVLCGEVLEEDVTVIRFSDLLCGQLLKRDRPTANPSIRQQLTGEDGTLERIKIDGEKTRPLTHGKAKIGKTAGQTIQQTCFI
jgi:predicted MarR family transcription regulator